MFAHWEKMFSICRYVIIVKDYEQILTIMILQIYIATIFLLERQDVINAENNF